MLSSSAFTFFVRMSATFLSPCTFCKSNSWFQIALCSRNSWVRLWRNFPTWRRFTAPGASPESVLITMSSAPPTPVARHRITKASAASLCGHQSFRGVLIVDDPRTVLDRLLPIGVCVLHVSEFQLSNLNSCVATRFAKYSKY